MSARPASLRDCRRAAAAIEFALLAPLLFAMLLGVLQIGLGMQSYNALRGIAADVARHVVVEYQKDNRLTEEQVRLFGTATAVQAPYLLDSQRISVSVDPAAVQRVAGARELSLTVSYRVPNIMQVIGLPDVTIRFSRPIFVAAGA